jgi:methylenetetrahydrofolate reductase (NADPH)
MPRMREFMKQVCDLGLHERAYILVGVGPLRSAKVAEWMRSKVPGMVIPNVLVRRLQGVPLARQREECNRICVEIIRELIELCGGSGVHVMAYRQEELVEEPLCIDSSIISALETGLKAYQGKALVN